MEHGGPWEILRVRGRHRPRDAYGLAGVALQTSKQAWGVIQLQSGTTGPTRFDIYYQRRPDGGQVAVTLDGRELSRFSTRSKTLQPGYLSVEETGRRLELRALGGGTVRIFGVSVERGTSGAIVDALGVPGAKARDQLPWDRETQRAHLQRTAPDLVVLEYGTNESGGDLQSMARYERDLRAVVTRLRSLRPEASCLLMGPTEWPVRAAPGVYRPRQRTGGIIEAQRRVAGEQGCGFFDTLAFMGGPGSMVRWVNSTPPLALSDHVHLTDDGHRHLAEALERALLAGL
jgi:lysophospholipase L1-like esterase